MGIRVVVTGAISVVIIVVITISVITIRFILTISELIVIRLAIYIESLIGKEGSFAINLLLLLLVYSNRRL
jgi:hypothetical protein